MNNSRTRLSRKLCLTLLISTLASCASKSSSDHSNTDTTQVTQPQWTEAFTLPSLLLDETVADSQQAIKTMLGQPWYASIAVENTRQERDIQLNNCETYFEIATPDIRAQKESEQNAFLEFQTACESAQILASAHSSTMSFLPKQTFTIDSPKQLPKSLALVISQTQLNTLQNDASKDTWADFNTIVNFEQITPHQALYHSKSGTQKLSEIGRGDFNQDGIEDILLRSEDSVAGGSYFNVRLFALTVLDSNGHWRELRLSI